MFGISIKHKIIYEKENKNKRFRNVYFRKR